jgi:hypothetical protein
MTLFVQYFIPCKQLYMFRVKHSQKCHLVGTFFFKLIHDARTDALEISNTMFRFTERNGK